MTLGPLRFTNAAGGTVDWVYPGPAIDLQSPASAGAVNGTTYLIYAESFDRSQWEIAEGAYTLSSGTFARTTILFNSLGTTAKISFLNPPAVSIYEIDASLSGFLVSSNNLSDVANPATALANLGIIPVSYKIVTFTRVLSVASGNQSITGVGFKPRLVQFQTGITSGSQWSSVGQSDGVSNTSIENFTTGSQSLNGLAGIQRDASGNYQVFSLASFDVDGFTLTWTKTGTPTLTSNVFATCYR